jgi:hypothetical protein
MTDAVRVVSIEPKKRETLFILYDGRAYPGANTSEASVCCTARTLKEARRDKLTMFPDAFIYEYDVNGNELINERFVE